MPPEPFPMKGFDMNGEAAGPLFFLFLSAFGFFFSRLPLNWPFAISSSLRGYPHISLCFNLR